MKKLNELILYQGINKSVTEYYYQIIIDALKDVDTQVLSFNHWNNFLSHKRNTLCIVGEAKHLFILYVLGFRRFVFWAQGAVGYESFMRHQSKFRFSLLSWLEKFALKRAKICVCVSNYQVDFYEQAYSIMIRPKSVVFPCFNTKIHPESFSAENKYRKNVFCYIGSLAVWQCFDETVKLYSLIENSFCGNCYFKIYTKDKLQAEKALLKYRVKNYIIDYLPSDKLNEALADCKYGFLLREDNVVNNVATPTKLSTYLANGIIPIFSSSLKDCVSLSHRYKHLLCVSDMSSISPILNHMKQTISASNVYNEYSKIFDEYYNEQIYIDKLKKLKSVI